MLFPDKAKMYIAAMDDEAYYKKKLVIIFNLAIYLELLEQCLWS
jgi:hypothetical protein